MGVDLRTRTKKFALDVLLFVDLLPKTMSANVIAKQLLRSATSVGASYRAAHRAKSDADFAYKIKAVEEAADESLYWLEIIMESNMLKENILLAELLKEANELTAIFSSISIKMKSKK